MQRRYWPLLLLIGGIVWFGCSEPPPTATPTITPTPNAQAMAAWYAGETATTELLLNTQPLYVTATAFIRGATKTQAAEARAMATWYAGETATTNFLLNTQPLYVTATAFILGATETRTVSLDTSPIPKPTRTPAPEKLTQQAIRYLTQLPQIQARATFIQEVKETAAAPLTISPTPQPPSATFAPETATIAARRVNTLFSYETATAEAYTAVWQTRTATTPSPMPTPIPQTETAAAHGTQSAQATLTAYHYSMEQTEFANLRDSLTPKDATETYLLAVQTQQALATQRADPTLAYLLDTQPLYVTATAYILGATQTQQARIPPTADATLAYLLEIQPLYVTATEYALQATYDKLPKTRTPSPTPEPTLNASEQQALHDRLKGELETAVGFYHPVFDEVLDKLVPSLNWLIESWGREHIANFHLEPRVERITYNGTPYVAVITLEDWNIGNHHFFLFRLDDDTPTLVLNLGSFDSEIYFGEGIYFPKTKSDGEGKTTAIFADRNGNGYPELLIYSAGNSGSSGCAEFATLVLLEFQPDGTIARIGPPVGDMRLIDLDNDGIMEIERLETIGDPFMGGDCTYLLPHWYAWDGTAYRDITYTLVDYHQFYIDQFWTRFEAQTTCPDWRHAWDIPGALLHYEAIGQSDLGWSRIQPRLYGELCPEGYPPNDYSSARYFWEWANGYLRSNPESDRTTP